MSSADDAMSRYAAGHNQSFGQVYDAVAPRLEGYLRRHLRHPALIEDIIQQTFLQIHAARGTFIPGAAVLPWTVAIARRLLIDSTRRSRREESLDTLDAQFVGVTVAAAVVLANGEETLTAHETEARLSKAYQDLTAPQRAAYELVTTEGLSHAEAAAVLGTTVTGVKLRVHRVTLALRASLEDPPPADLAAGVLAGAPAARRVGAAGREGGVFTVPASGDTLPAPTRGDPR